MRAAENAAVCVEWKWKRYRLRLLRIFGVFFVFSSLVASAYWAGLRSWSLDEPDRGERLYREARRAFEEARFPEALLIAEAAVAVDSMHEDARALRDDCREGVAPPRAASKIEDGLVIEAITLSAELNLQLATLSSEEVKEVARVHRLFEEGREAFDGLRYREAEEKLAAAMEADETHQEARILWNKARFLLGDLPEDSRARSNALYKEGKASYESFRYGEAMEKFRAAVAADSDNLKARYLLKMSRILAGETSTPFTETGIECRFPSAGPEEVALRLKDGIESAEMRLQDGDLKGAREKAEYVLESLKWNAYPMVEAENFEARAKAVLEAVKTRS